LIEAFMAGFFRGCGHKLPDKSVAEQLFTDWTTERKRNNVKIARVMKGWSQTDLAFELGVTQAYISNIESGDRIPTDDMKAKLCKVLHNESLAEEIFPCELGYYSEDSDG